MTNLSRLQNCPCINATVLQATEISVFLLPPDITILWGVRGGTLRSDVTLNLVGVFVIDYACQCRTSTLIMVPINFWRNSDPFKKEEHFSS